MNSQAQTDLFRDTPKFKAEAYREAAKTARIDPHFTVAEAERRAAFYEREAARLEREA